MKLHKKILIQGTLTCVTGLHVGASKESVDIGGVDLPVIRRKDNNQPYIPGSSLKGKIRCLLEQLKGENGDSKFRNTGSEICQLFGGLENKEAKLPHQPSRILVRDAYLTSSWAEQLANLESTDMPFTEVKFENSIDRITGVAGNPRQIERVPAGAEFRIEFVINLVADQGASGDELEELQEQHLRTLARGISLLNKDYLGGHGSRGYGQVEITVSDVVPMEEKDFLQIKALTQSA